MTPAANNPTPSKPPRWLRPVASAAAVIALSAATGWGVASLASPAQAPDTAKVRAALKLRLPKTPIDAITCDGLGGLCEVASKSTLFYVDRAAKYLVIGRIYDMEARQDLTAARLLALNPDPAQPARHSAEGVARRSARKRRDHLGSRKWSQGGRLLRLSLRLLQEARSRTESDRRAGRGATHFDLRGRQPP